jgi:hypothetical protein
MQEWSKKPEPNSSLPKKGANIFPWFTLLANFYLMIQTASTSNNIVNRGMLVSRINYIGNH